MVKKAVVGIVLILVMVGLVFGNNIMADENISDNEIVATVNSEDLSLDQLNQYAGVSQLTSNLAYLAPDFADVLQSTESGTKLMAEYRKVKLDDMIKDTLLKQEAENNDITEEEKDSFFTNYIKNVKKQNDLTDEELLDTLSQQGFESLDDFKEYYFNNGGQISVLQEQILAQVTVEDDVIEEYYNNNQDDFKTEGEEGETEIKSLKEVKDDIKNSLLADKQQKQWNEYVTQLQEKADIEKYI